MGRVQNILFERVAILNFLSSAHAQTFEAAI